MAAAPPHARFGDRASAYTRGRPGYPDAAVGYVVEGLPLQARAVDVGAGTGAFTAALLEHGLEVVALEPNEAMRRAGAERLGDHVALEVRAGTAEATGLPDDAFDLVTCAQTFHWVDPARFRAECLRILRRGGRVAVLWNVRRTDGTAFARAYEDFLDAHAVDYAEVKRSWEDRAALETFFGGDVPARVAFPHTQRLDLAALVARAESSSYLPGPEDPRAPAMRRALEALFEAHADDGAVSLEYDCAVYRGRLH